MSKIERIELFHVNVPMSKPFYPSWIPGYPQTAIRFTLIRLTTDDGVVGLTAGNAFGNEREGLGDLLGAFLIGLRADDIDSVRKRLREASYLGWRNFWIENAFWDLKAKLLGKPLYKLFQTHEQTVTKAKIYASSGSLLPFHQRREWLDRVRAMGVNAVKLRVHGAGGEEDLKIVREVRAYGGDDLTIGVDANQGWPVSLIQPTTIWSLEDATRFGKGCDDLNVSWLEEPLDMHDWEGMAELRRRIRTPVSGGELHQGWHELRPLFDHHCLDKYQPDTTFCGFTVALQVMEKCREQGLKYSPHTWTNGLGLLVNVHAFAAWEGYALLEYPLEPPGLIPLAREGIIPPIEINSDGTIDVPQEPGTGIRIDEKLLRRYGHRFYVATPLRIAARTIREKGLKTALEIKRNKG